VHLIGASVEAIKVAEDRLKFKDAMRSIGVDVPDSVYAKTIEQALDAAQRLGFPAIIRPSFTLGGVGGGIAYNVEEFREIATRGLGLSPVHEILVEESVIGWKEFELEVMRDKADNVIIVCSIENFDAMGVHTGDSITVAPQQTLTNDEYQAMRDEAKRIIRAIGVETGGSNIQFAVHPTTGRRLAIGMNPRVFAFVALASKATGFPIAKFAAGWRPATPLDEIRTTSRAGRRHHSGRHRLRRGQRSPFRLREIPLTAGSRPLGTVGRRGGGDRPFNGAAETAGRSVKVPDWKASARQRSSCPNCCARPDRSASCDRRHSAGMTVVRFMRCRSSIRGSCARCARSSRSSSRRV
jgi:hypothetical protein